MGKQKMSSPKMSMLVTALFGLTILVATQASAATPKKGHSMPKLRTDVLGGVPTPTKHVLKAMHQGQYILHALGGRMARVPVEKVLLPHDPKAVPQSVRAVLAPDGTVYVTLASIICKSIDGGRTWSSHPLGSVAGFSILSDGRFIGLRGGGKTTDPADVVTSSDEGRTWRKISEIDLGPNCNQFYVYWMLRLSDDTLVCAIELRDHLREEKGVYMGTRTFQTWRSTDKGITWQGPSDLDPSGCEGWAVQTASGKLLAVVRHQPLGEVATSRSHPRSHPLDRYYPKNVFLTDSNDQGKSWHNLRPLTTVEGQCFGFPAALSNGTVVVIHDTRYGPGGPGGRAMISHDEGNTWSDEVYYMDSSVFTSGNSGSVVLKDDLILTIVGTSDGLTFADATDNTDMTAIRWRLGKN